MRRLAQISVGFLAMMGLQMHCYASEPHPDPGVDTVYVSPEGDDENAGADKESAVRTLSRAQQIVRGYTNGSVCLLPGHYKVDKTLEFTKLDSGESWIGCSQEEPVLDGGGETEVAISVEGATHISFIGLTIQKFSVIGIRATDVSEFLAENNVIRDIQSTDWNQGAIVLFGGVHNGRISNNQISRVGYAGILAAKSTPDRRIDGLEIEKNIISDVCVDVHDCGAIYVNNRHHLNEGVMIRKNTIHNFGTTENQSKAIYLDDLQSDTIAIENVISGTGTYAFQIHGGDHNLIAYNIIDVTGLRALGLYQSADPRFGDFGMRENVFKCNRIVVRKLLHWVAWESDLNTQDVSLESSENDYPKPAPQMRTSGSCQTQDNSGHEMDGRSIKGLDH